MTQRNFDIPTLLSLKQGKLCFEEKKSWNFKIISVVIYPYFSLYPLWGVQFCFFCFYEVVIFFVLKQKLIFL